ncbi:MAG: helix-turn-helix domain-containing protein [Desulfobulbus sp.]|nr:helix-turn-helix domain-containing protein [Desulfobulbus sp.]
MTENNTASAQRQRILEHLKHASLTTLEARSLGIMHPGMRVCELRKLGHQITTEKVNEYCPGGVRHRVARYILKPNGEVAHD